MYVLIVKSDRCIEYIWFGIKYLSLVFFDKLNEIFFVCIIVVGCFWNENRKMKSLRDVVNFKGLRNYYDIFCKRYWGM